MTINKYQREFKLLLSQFDPGDLATHAPLLGSTDSTGNTHLRGILTARYLSMAMARRLKMELWVSTSTKQAMKRQP